MDIQAPYTGQVARSAGQGREALTIRLPVAFRNVSITSQGLVDCRIDAASVGGTGETLLPLSAVAISSGDHKLIERRPVRFRSDTSDDINTLIFECRLGRATGRLDELNGGTLILSLTLVFSSLQQIQFEATITVNFDAAILTVTRFKRVHPPGPVLSNLFILLIAVTVLALWNLVLNVDVHRQPPFLAQNLVSVGIGGVLAFVGLSLSRIRRWFSALTNVSGLVDYPELYIESTLANVLRSRATSVVLTLVLLSVISVIVVYWPIQLRAPSDGRLAVFDRRTSRTVDAGKVYWVHAYNGRFVIAASQDTLQPKQPILGVVEAGPLETRSRPHLFEVIFPAMLNRELAGRGNEEPYRRRMRGFCEEENCDLALLDLKLALHHEDLQAVLEGRASEVVTYRPGSHSGTDLARIEIISRPMASVPEIEAQVNLFWHDQPNRDLEGLWSDREDVIGALTTHLTQHIDKNVAFETYARVVANLVDGIRGTARHLPDTMDTVKRCIQVRAVTRSLIAERAVGYDVIDFEELTRPVQDRFATLAWGEVNYRVFRAIWEMLLELELTFSQFGEASVHPAIWPAPGPDVRTIFEGSIDPVMHYLGVLFDILPFDTLNQDERRLTDFGKALDRLTPLIGDFAAIAKRVIEIRSEAEYGAPTVPPSDDDLAERVQKFLGRAAAETRPAG